MTWCDRILNYWPVVVLGWIIVFALALPFAATLEGKLVASGEVDGGEASLVNRDIGAEFGRSGKRTLVLVIANAPDILHYETAALESIVEEIEELVPEGVVVSYFSSHYRYLVAPSGDGMLVVVELQEDADIQTSLKRLRRLTALAQATLRDVFPDITFAWTGESAMRADLVATSSRDLKRSELLALPLSFLLLIWAFRSLAASLVPILSGLVTVVIALGIASLVSATFPLSIMVQSVISLLGLALGIDYALLMVARYREARAGTDNQRQAVLEALNRAGKTLILSGSTVAIGFLGLALVPIDQLHSVAFAGVIVAILSVGLATTLLPVLLLFFGQWIDFGRLPGQSEQVGASLPWRNWGARVTRRPISVILVFAAPLIALSFFARDLSLDFPAASWLPREAQSVQAISDLEGMGRAGIVYRLQVLYRLAPGATVAEGESWQEVQKMAAFFAGHPMIDRVFTIPGAFSPFVTAENLLQVAAGAEFDRYLSVDRSQILFELYPMPGQSPGQISALVREMRSGELPELAALSGDLRIGGLPAGAADYEDLVRAWLPYVILAVASGSFLALAVGFRSLLIPLKAVGLNLFAVMAAYGAIVLVFVHGFGIAIFGLEGSVSGLFPTTPILVFCTAFGISMDYEVFLLSRIREERMGGASERDAIIGGLAHTGRLITSAAAIMTVVFGAFALGDILPTQILGFALAVVVTIDAVFIRVAIGPALITLAGRLNWWPSKM